MFFLFDVQNANLTKISQKEKRKTLINKIFLISAMVNGQLWTIDCWFLDVYSLSFCFWQRCCSCTVQPSSFPVLCYSDRDLVWIGIIRLLFCKCQAGYFLQK